MSHQLAKEDEHRLNKDRMFPWPRQAAFPHPNRSYYGRPAATRDGRRQRRSGRRPESLFGHHEPTIAVTRWWIERTNKQTMLPFTVNGGWLRPFLHRILDMILLGCPLFIVPLRCEAQNLVPNPSFEIADSCKAVLGFYEPNDGPLGWFTAYLTPDHLQSCLPYGTVNGMPMSLFTFQEPLDGESCVGIFTYHKNGQQEQREWVMVQLLDSMVVGQTYFASFYANAGFGGNALYPQIWLASNNIGMLFTTTSRQWLAQPYPAALNISHVRRTTVLSDTLGWTLVSGSFVADSAYKYLMIGNFYENAQTDTVHFADPSSVPFWLPRGYTLIDNVCVSADPNGCDLEQGFANVATSTVVVSPNPAIAELWVSSARGATATIRDALGRLAWQGVITQERQMLDVGAWARGYYVLNIALGSERSSFKFVLTE